MKLIQGTNFNTTSNRRNKKAKTFSDTLNDICITRFGCICDDGEP